MFRSTTTARPCAQLIMTHSKAYKSGAIRSWTGGAKVADMPGQPRRLTRGALDALPSGHFTAARRAAFVAAAEAVWDGMAAAPECLPAATAMLARMRRDPIQRCARLGRTAFNAYSINLDYRTACHTDGKNVPGSLSALLVLETGDPFAGGLYMLPQYRVGFEVRQGGVLLHRSGDPGVGLHGNSQIHLPTPESHRISVRFACSSWYC
jgi:hypothetical protein